jgi:tetratricopeptide (TPR) repeat protein
MEIKMYDRAIDEFDRALKLEPGNLAGLLGQGDCFARKGRTHQALIRYQDAAATHTDSPKPFLKIGALYLREDNAESRDEASQAFLRATKIDPECKEAYNNLGVISMQAARVDDAARKFEKAIKIDDEFADAHLNLGILNEEFRRNRILALHHYYKYLALDGPRADEVRKWVNDLQEK